MTFLSSHLAPLMIPIGLTMLVLGIRRAAAGLRRYHRDPPRALALLRGFRISIVGLCLAGVGAGLFWDIGWLVGLSLIIGGEELLESTVVITAMTHGVSPRGARSTRSPVPASTVLICHLIPCNGNFESISEAFQREWRIQKAGDSG